MITHGLLPSDRNNIVLLRYYTSGITRDGERPYAREGCGAASAVAASRTTFLTGP